MKLILSSELVSTQWANPPNCSDVAAAASKAIVVRLDRYLPPLLLSLLPELYWQDSSGILTNV